MRRILFLAQAEVLHIVRDRILVAQILVVPIVQLLILSNAATFQIRNTSIHIVDLDRTSTSRGLASHLAASGHFPDCGHGAVAGCGERGLAGRYRHDGRGDPARLRGLAGAHRRRAG
jgi:ABC-2 type transport system permease protein